MTVHLIKLCVGIDSVNQLASVQETRRAEFGRAGREALNRHITRNTPRRRDDVTDGGSLYWVIRRQIRVRQRILRIEDLTDDEGRRCCALVLDPELVRVEPRACRPFQGWRYLEPADAPGDLTGGEDDTDDMPDEMRRELRALGLL